MTKEDIISLGYEFKSCGYTKEEKQIKFSLQKFDTHDDRYALLATIRTAKNNDPIHLKSDFYENKEDIIRLEDHFRRLSVICESL